MSPIRPTPHCQHCTGTVYRWRGRAYLSQDAAQRDRRAERQRQEGGIRFTQGVAASRIAARRAADAFIADCQTDTAAHNPFGTIGIDAAQTY